MDAVVRGLRQAAVAVLATAGVVLAVAGLWSAAQDTGFLRTAGAALLGGAGLTALGSGAVFSRMHDYEHGRAPSADDSGSPGDVLTGLGVFLFVSLPLALAGLVLVAAA